MKPASLAARRRRLHAALCARSATSWRLDAMWCEADAAGDVALASALGALRDALDRLEWRLLGAEEWPAPRRNPGLVGLMVRDLDMLVRRVDVDGDPLLAELMAGLEEARRGVLRQVVVGLERAG